MSEPRLLGIFAHPDDEGVMGAAFLQYADAGVDTGLICATRQDTRGVITYSQFGDSAGRGTSLAWIDRLPPA